MDPNNVRQHLIQVLQQIQNLSGLECPKLVGQTRPAEDIPEFDSKMWPVATGMLATSLGVEIAPDVNLFRVGNTKIATTIDEAVAKVCILMANAIATAAE
jgi:hypothetical protein